MSDEFLGAMNTGEWNATDETTDAGVVALR